MSLIVSCSNCEKKYKVGDDKAGKKIKCPGCGTIISIPGAADPAAPAAPVEEDDPWESAPAPASSHEDEGDDDFELPPPRRPAPRRPVSRGSRSGGGMPTAVKVLLIVFGSIGGIVLLGCGGCTIVGLVSREALKQAAKSGSSPGSGGSPSAAVWTKFSDPDRSFEVEFPAANVVTEPTAEGKQYHASIRGMDTDFRIGCAVTGVDSLTVEQQRTALNLVRDDVVKAQHATAVRSNEVQIGPHIGLEAEMKVVAQGIPMEFTGRFVYIKDRFYQIQVVRPAGASLRNEIDRFFNSFRSLK